MIIKPIGNVETPRKPRRGMDMLAFCESVYRSIQQLRDRVFVVHTQQASDAEKPNPFDVILFTEDGNHSVIVHDGIIIERFPGGTESATKEHTVENIKEGDGVFPPASPGDRVRFPVKIGDQVSIFFECRPDGSIKDVPTVIVTKEDENPSVHWAPPAGDDAEGMFGEFWYKLATIEAGERPETAKIKPCLMGSHINHWAEIPRLENTIQEATENVGRVVKDFDKDLSKFNIRSIRNKHPLIKITESDEAIEIEEPYDTGGGAVGKNLNLSIYQMYIDNDGHVYDLGTSPSVLYFRNGSYVGMADPDNGNIPAQLDIHAATFLSTAP